MAGARRSPSGDWAEPLIADIERASDIELARCARDGDESAFEEIVRRFSPRVFHIASRFFRQRSLVEEVAQDVFLKTFTEIGSYRGSGPLEGWISRIATNECLNHIRRTKSRPELTLADLTGDEHRWLEARMAEADERRGGSFERGIIAAELAEKLLAAVSPEDRLILLLMDGEGLSVKETAVLTGWSVAKVKVRAMRARNKIRKAIEGSASRRDHI